MKNIERYMIVQAVKINNNELIPIWDERLKYRDSEDSGDYVEFESCFGKYYYVVDCIYDLKHKNLSVGIELDYYPDKLEFSIGDEVYREINHRELLKDKIINILYENFDLEIRKGSKVDEWWIRNFKEIEFITNKLYAIKQWKPKYVLDSGFETEYNHELYHISK